MNNTWYHGTTGKAVREIVGTREFNVPEYSRAYLHPMEGRVYISRSIDEALKYSVFRSWHIDKPQEAGVLELQVKNPNILWPDEDELGRIIALGYLDMDKIDDKWLETKEELLFNRIWNNLSIDYKEKIERIDRFRLDEYAYWAMLGKRAIHDLYLRKSHILRDIVGSFENASSPSDNLLITNAWVFNQKKGSMVENHWSPHLRTVMNGAERIKARGMGRGWHNEPTRHALASRGVRTR
jgi:hypothetical protein